VKIDWLEDSLTMSKSRKPLDEAKYAYEQRNIKTKKASRTRKRNGHDKSHPNHDQLGVDDPNDKAGQKGEIAGTQVNTVADKHVEVGVHSTPGRDPATAKKKKQQQQQEQKHVATVVKKKQQQQPRLGWADQELHCSKDEQIEISGKSLYNLQTSINRTLLGSSLVCMSCLVGPTLTVHSERVRRRMRRIREGARPT
jgi:hypothetical protein